ncbi:MAG: hypothetical protein ABIP89_23905, partial [Polyangiaceae bacterium]
MNVSLSSVTAFALLVVLSGEARAQEPAVTEDAEPPLAGWHEGLFYLHDREDYFRLYVQGRV